ncbi:hypothetical protein D3C80_1654780 [compost metagenome]
MSCLILPPHGDTTVLVIDGISIVDGTSRSVVSDGRVTLDAISANLSCFIEEGVLIGLPAAAIPAGYQLIVELSVSAIGIGGAGTLSAVDILLRDTVIASVILGTEYLGYRGAPLV